MPRKNKTYAYLRQCRKCGDFHKTPLKITGALCDSCRVRTIYKGYKLTIS